MKRIIPKEKIEYQRFGQLIYNAIRNEYRNIWSDKNAIADVLFNVENDKLERMIQDSLNPKVNKNK